jgi:hypothetical protein
MQKSALRAARGIALSVALGACGPKAELSMSPSNVDPADAGSDPDPTDASTISDATTHEGSTLMCSVTAPTSCPDPPPHYADVAPIFQERCILCHSGTIDGPWPLTDYEHIADWQDIIRGDLLDCTMPPVDAGVPITRDERLAILVWIRCALPR